MERIIEISRILPFEAFIGLFALGCLAILFFLRSIEVTRGTLFGGEKRLKLDEKVAEMHNQALLRGYFVAKNISQMPKIIFQSMVHSGALLALSAVRSLERILKHVLDAVRGRRQLSTDMPPSAFLANIAPKRKPEGPTEPQS